MWTDIYEVSCFELTKNRVCAIIVLLLSSFEDLLTPLKDLEYGEKTENHGK